MSITVYAWDDDAEGLVSWPDRLRVASLEVTTMAEEIAAGSGVVELDDTTSDFYVYGYRPMYFVEENAVGDPYLGIIGPFWTERRVVKRGNERTGSRRIWEVTVRDINSLLNLRVQKGTDAERDAETDVERVDWLINTAEVIGGFGDNGYSIEETEFFFTDAPVDMSESDYTGQYSEGVLNDCMQQSGANCYLYPAPIEDEPLRIGIWYGRTEREDFQSIHKISNDPADISPEVLTGFDGVTPQYDTGYVFPPSLDMTLERDPSRQITGVMVQYDGGYVYDSNPAPSVVLTRRDMVFAGELVKNSTQALARAVRYLEDLESEDDAIECSVQVPDWLLHAFVAGNRVQFKATHLASLGYDEYVWMRVAKVTTRQVQGEDYEAHGWYELALDLRAETPPGPPGPPPPEPGNCVAEDPTEEGFYGPNNGDISAGTGNVHYFVSGSAAPFVVQPGYDGNWHFPAFGSGGSPDYAGDCTNSNARCVVVGDGTITIHTSVFGASRTLQAVLKHLNGAVEVTDELQTGIPLGSDIVFNISSHDGEFCTHWVDVHDDGGGCGSKWGFSGFDWVPA